MYLSLGNRMFFFFSEHRTMPPRLCKCVSTFSSEHSIIFFDSRFRRRRCKSFTCNRFIIFVTNITIIINFPSADMFLGVSISAAVLLGGKSRPSCVVPSWLSVTDWLASGANNGGKKILKKFDVPLTNYIQPRVLSAGPRGQGSQVLRARPRDFRLRQTHSDKLFH